MPDDLLAVSVWQSARKHVAVTSKHAWHAPTNRHVPWQQLGKIFAKLALSSRIGAH